MKNLLAAFVVAALSYTPVYAETVIFSEGGITNFSVSIPSGKMLAVRVYGGSSVGSVASFSKGGITLSFSDLSMNAFNTKKRAKYLVGPGTFAIGSSYFYNQEGVLFSYDTLPNQGISTIVATNNSDFSVTNFASFQIPAGKRMRILDGSFPVTLRIAATNGVSARVIVTDDITMSSEQATLPDAFEISGPCTVSIARPWNSSAPSYYLTYYFVSDVVQAASQSIVSPAGSLVVVEKSADLTNWYPAFFTTDQASPQSFFRLNISR